MRKRLLLYLGIIVAAMFIIIGLLTALKLNQHPKQESSDHGVQFPALSRILNKSGFYSFSYVNAHGKRLAAIDELGNRYFYIYSPDGDLNKIIDERNKTIWITNSS